MRTILRLGYTNILLQEGIDAKDAVALFDNAEIVQKYSKKWELKNDETEIEVISVLNKAIWIDKVKEEPTL
jgi:uncharacterized protein YijF (DUF1287 family)